MVIGLADPKITQGHRSAVGLISYGSGKLGRVARSSLSAEVQSLTRTEDETYICRLLWAELLGRDVDLNNIDATVRTVATSLVIDAKSIYDCLVKRAGLQQLAEKRTGLELLAYSKCIEEVGIDTRWCHSEANLADSMTKTTAPVPMQRYMKHHSWAVVLDEELLSTKKRKERGLDRFDANFNQNLTEVLQLNTHDDDDDHWMADYPNNLDDRPRR